MRVNVRPAPKFRWNKRAQWGDEPKNSALTADVSALINTENVQDSSTRHLQSQDEQIEREQIEHAQIQSETSSQNVALPGNVTPIKAVCDKASTAATTEVSPLEMTALDARSSEARATSQNLCALSDFGVAEIDRASSQSNSLAGTFEEPVVVYASADDSDAGVNEGGTNDDDNWQRIVWQLMPETPVGRALVSATQRLESSDIDTASLDAQVILAHILGQDRAWLFAHHDYLLSEEQASQFTECVVRRMAYEPVAYLIGQKEFYGLNFLVDHRVLIPRPETELLVDSVLSHLEMRADEMPVGQQLCVADVGTGCGAIAISVATNAPDVRVFATDISLDALEITRANIRRLDQRFQVSLLPGDLLEPLRNKVDMPKVDIIVANLPYINSTDYDGLAPDVRDFEPQLALEAGPQGLDSIARLLEQAPDFLNINGIIVLEIGYDQGEAVVDLANRLIPQASVVELRQDYNGRDRLVTIAL